MDSIHSIISVVSKELSDNDSSDSNGDDFCERLAKKAKRYLRNVLGAVGVNIKDLRTKNNYKKATQHKIGGELSKIIAEHARNNDFPNNSQILDSIDVPSPLTAEVIRVAKLYLKDNFTQDVYIGLSEQIDENFENIIELIETNIKSQEDLLQKIRSNMVSLKFRTVHTIQNLHEVIYGIYHFIENYSPNETPHLTEDELIMIDFIRLNKILNNIYKDVQFEHSIKLLSLKR